MSALSRMVALWVLAVSPLANAQTPVAFVSVGGGPQPNGQQQHYTAGADLELWRHQRTARQWLSIGASYTYLRSDQGPNKRLHALGLYPQLTLNPANPDFMAGVLPAGAQPYFFVRALGPSYISRSQLGSRQQHNHLTFQAMFGVGMRLPAKDGERHVTLAWKHFSNANLYGDNDGIDVPLVLSFGMSL